MANSLASEEAEKIINKYADMIYRIAFQNLKNRADAEDIFQDVCIALITKNPPSDSEEHLKRWLIRVTVNKCCNVHKSVWKTRVEPIDEHLDLPSKEEKEVMEEIWELPKKYRNVIYLYYYESYTIPEIAEILGKSQNTVSSRLTRARKKLRTILTDSKE